MQAPGRWKFMLVDPKKAQEFLATMPKNRPLRNGRVESMTEAILKNEFEVTHQGMAVNCDGSLKDGQHRCHAIIRSGVGIWLWVYYGLQERAMRVIDTHAPRNDADGLNLSGVPCTSAMVAVAKRMKFGLTSGDRGKPVNRNALAEFIETHREAIEFAMASIGGKSKGITHASVVGVVARAYYTADRGRLKEFCEILKSGMTKNSKTDQACIRLRDYLLQSDLVCGGSAARATIAAYTEDCLQRFLKGQQSTRVNKASKELFPLPEETATPD